VADHPGPHGGEHFLPVSGIEQHRLSGFWQATAATAAVLRVLLPAIGGREHRFVAGLFVAILGGAPGRVHVCDFRG